MWIVQIEGLNNWYQSYDTCNTWYEVQALVNNFRKAKGLESTDYVIGFITSRDLQYRVSIKHFEKRSDVYNG